MMLISLLSGVLEAEGRRPTWPTYQDLLPTSLQRGAHSWTVGCLSDTYQAPSSLLRAEKTKASHVFSAAVRAPLTYGWLLEQSLPSQCFSFDPLCKYALCLGIFCGLWSPVLCILCPVFAKLFPFELEVEDTTPHSFSSVVTWAGLWRSEGEHSRESGSRWKPVGRRWAGHAGPLHVTCFVSLVWA